MLLALLGAAFAAVPFELPTSERPADWATPLALAGFTPGPAGEAPSAALLQAGDGWRLVVRDVNGQTHDMAVAAPRTPREREDVAWVAQSLLDPVVPPFGEVSRAETRGTPATRPARTPVRPTPIRAPPPAQAAVTTDEPTEAPVEAELEATTGLSAALPVEVAMATTAVLGAAPSTAAEPTARTMAAEEAPSRPPESAPSVRPRLRIGAQGGLRGRDGIDPAPFGQLALGVQGRGVTAALALAATAPAELDTDGRADAAAAGERGLLLLGVESSGRIAPFAAFGAGMVHQRFVQNGEDVATAWVPVVAGEAGAHLPLGAGFSLEGTVRGTWDTRRLHLTVEGAPTGGWSDWGVEVGLGLVFDIPR